MCRECDEIKYLYEKITIFKYIRNLIFKKHQIEKEKEFNNEVKEQFKNILELIIKKKRIPILQLYEKFSYRNKEELTQKEMDKIGINCTFGEKIDSWSNHFYEIFKVGQITKFITESLKYYETKAFFNKIIVIENNEKKDYYDELIIKKIRRIIDQFLDIENEILKIKINSFIEEGQNLESNKIINNKESNSDNFEILYRRLAQIRNDSLDFFDHEYKNLSSNLLYKILVMENRTFYEKIDYINSLKYMIGVLNYYRDKKDKNVLGYICNLLRIFSKIIEIYPNFNKTVQENFELYHNMILNAFQCISEYPNIDLNIESTFLKIFYYGMESFLYIIINCKLDFKDIRDNMEEIFEVILNLIDNFKTIKNKLIYQILYLYTVCRILLFLNKEKTYEFNSYKYFYSKIFPVKKVKTFFFIKFDNKEENKKKLIDSINTINTIKEKSENSIDEINTNLNNNNFDFPLTNFNVFPNEMHTYKLESPNINIDKKTTLNNNIGQESKYDKSLLNESLEWYDYQQFERLSFYALFLLVYNLYLNEKNEMSKDTEEDINDKNNTEELSLNSLFQKMNVFLSQKNQDKYIVNNYNYNITSKTYEEITSLIDSHISANVEFEDNSEIQNDPEKEKKDPGLLFIFSLFQGIVNYQHASRHKSIEIPVKLNKKNDDKNLENEHNYRENEKEILLNNKENNSIIFYYYDSEYIDIILLEKIINELSLKTNLKNYCLELCDEDNFIIPDILKQFLKNQTYYKLISNYYKNEYNIINSLFVQNNISILLKKLFHSFNQEDLSEIESMNYFLYKKMGEIYNYKNIKKDDDLSSKNSNLIDYLKLFEEKSNDLIKINLLSFFDSLVYIYPNYDKNLCLLYYKLGFEILHTKCSTINNQSNEEDEDSQDQIDLELIIKVIIFLFNRKSNRILIEDKYVFNTMLLSMRELYKSIINNNTFVLKHLELIKDFLSSLDFILGHLSRDFIKLVNFMKKPENLDNSNKFRTKKNKLEITLDFFIALLKKKKNFDEKVLTEEIMNFAKETIERTVKLLFLLIEIDKDKSIEIMNSLLDYIFKFIKGPDIENVNMLFSLGFLDLVSYVITSVDYYKLFISYLNKENIHEIIDNFSIIECKIIKIFIAYYNISYSPYSNKNEFEKLQYWYENNFAHIKKKFKKLFYISEKEMENRQYDINKMLLFIKEDDKCKYSDDELFKRAGILITDNNDDEEEKNENKDEDQNENEISIKKENDDDQNENEIENEGHNENEIKNKKKNENHIRKNSDFCIIKFDLLLSYYTLFNYHKDLSDIKEKNALSHIKKSKKNIFYWIINFFIDFGLFLINLIIVLIFFLYFFFKRFSVKKKNDVDLLQELSEIEVKSEAYSEKKIINFLRNYIREIEVSIENVIYKVYFPMINKANTLLDYRKEYLKVDEIDSSDFINYLLSKYDHIFIRAKQNSKINRWLWEIPILSYIFKNMYIYGVLLIVLGSASNLLIMCSFSTFFDQDIDNKILDCPTNFVHAKNDHRVQCPFIFLNKKSNSENLAFAIRYMGIIELILQGLTFLDYLIRKLAIESEIVKLNYKIDKLKKNRKKTILQVKVNKITYLVKIILPTIYRCFFNFQTIYYIISLLFLALGIGFHPFFNCIVLLEFVNRIQLMQTILKAMYKPAKDILITLLMFIILEYFFSFFAVSYYTTHFPNETDTSTFLKTFMRMMDQTFKQDGGIGTYLQKSLDKDFVAYSVPAYFNSRFFFDLLFFLIILLLIFQMFLSIIIDYFNETRENSETIESNLESQCIVCGIDREKIEKINSNDKNAFEKHITYNHNVFNYIYYLMYLQSSSNKDVIIDNSVWDLHLVKNLSYLPKNICFKQLEKKCWKKKLNQNKNEEEEN